MQRIWAKNLEEARLLVIDGQNFLPVAGKGRPSHCDTSIRRVSLCRGKDHTTRNT